MKYQEQCDHCHGISAAYTHNINFSMISAFKQFVQKFEETDRAVNISTDLKLTHNQICDIIKLQYYGLMQRTHEGGYWKPTDIGLLFYHGAHAVTMPVATINNHVLKDDHPAWETHHKARRTAKIMDFFEKDYKQHQDYADEKNTHLPL